MRLSDLALAFFALIPALLLATATPAPAPEQETPEKRQGIIRDVPLLLTIPGQVILPTIEEIISANLTNGSYVQTDRIQGDILIGMSKNIQTFFFFHINDAAGFKTALKNTIHSMITSTTQILSTPDKQPLAMVNIAFTQSGLNALNVLDPLGDLIFPGGMAADASNLGDPGTTNWDDAFKGTDTHGVFLIASDQQGFIDDALSTITGALGDAITERTTVNGAARPGDQQGHEHFGFLDGIGQPSISGFNPKPNPGQEVSLPGTILLGELGDVGVRPLWAKDGSFLVFRKLKQMVPEFNKYISDNAIVAPDGSLTQEEGAELLGARMIGRWRSGAPVDLFPRKDNPAAGTDSMQNNNFDYNHPLPFVIATNESFCPWTAHVRKTRPRADELDVNGINVGIRCGIPYGPEVTDAEAASSVTTVDRGLAFVEYQSDIALGYRFQQTMWSNSETFPPLKIDVTPGFDTIVGQNNGGTRTAGGLDPFNQTRDYVLIDFIISEGGDYFFSPPIPALLDPIAL